MSLLIYLIKTVLISALLLAYYMLFLRNRSFHGFNRLFLLAVPVFSFLLPALHFDFPAYWNLSSGGSPIRLLGVGQGTLEEAVHFYAGKQKGPALSRELTILVTSLLISVVLSMRFYNSVRSIYILRRNKKFLKLPEARVYFVSDQGTPFSFFKNIFWNEEMKMESREGRQILRHEIFHVIKNHTLDILFMEIFSILCWFNPFIHILRRELQAIHEYGADMYASAETDKYEYAGLLLIKVTGNAKMLTHPFFENQIKKRITMITKTSKSKKSVLGRFMILPLLTVLICLFSFNLPNQAPSHTSKTMRVVIDAGHGGAFSGFQTNGIYEKNINLDIAKKIQSLSKEYQVEVIMSREKDEEITGNDLGRSLNYRAALAEKNHADLFISIHANGKTAGESQDEYSGFEIYVPANASKVYNGSVKLASGISDYLKNDYIIAPELKQSTGSIQVLDKATVPAILIECGYMDNKSDLAYMQDQKNQEKIARAILEGIKKYADQSPGQ